MSDKIAEIQAQHEIDERWRNGPSMLCPQSHDHRGILLAEVERLQTAMVIDNKILDEVVRERDEARAEVERQARHIEALQAKIDAEGSCGCSYDSPSDVCVAHSPALMAARGEVKRLRAEVERLRDEVEKLRAEREKMFDSLRTAAANFFKQSKLDKEDGR